MSTPSTSRLPLASRRITVMGLGRFGGGIGVARFLAGEGAQVLVTDQESPENLAASVEKIADLVASGRVTLRLGEHRTEDFAQADLVVASPAVKPNSPFLAAARAAGVAVTSEIRLLAERLPDRRRVIALTGSAGKSTTTALVGHALAEVFAAEGKGQGKRRRVWVGGNIGGSLLADLPKIGADDIVVLELSSFMLEGLREDGFAPGVAVVTNLAPNHLDWHPTLADYAAAKKSIFRFQKPGDTLLLGPRLAEWAKEAPAGVTVKSIACDDAWWDKRVAALPAGAAFRLPGAHNRQNARMAVEACAAAGFAPDAVFAACCTFAGLPHRLQFVAEKQEVCYYNDSKSTTPEALMLAVDSFPDRTVHAIVGGKDKGSDLSGMAAHLAAHARAVYTVGMMGEAVALKVEAQEKKVPVVRCGTVGDAVAAAAQAAKAGEVVVLSPAFASWDQFPNYEVRGEAFVAAVGAL